MKDIDMLVEDEQLIKDLVIFCRGRYYWCCRSLTENDIKGLLKRKDFTLNLHKYAEPGSDYVFEMECVHGYPTPEELLVTPKRYNFREVIEDFVNTYPDKCRWKGYSI